jgi:hypothetical protein
MKSVVIIFLLMFMVLSLSAQEKKDAPPVYGWDNKAMANLNLSQIALKDWTRGGDDAMAFTILTIGNFTDAQEFYKWASTMKFTYGRAKFGSGALKKTDDELFMESVLSYNVGWKVNPFASVSFRTQFDKGYNAKDSAISAFMDPGYLVESAGFIYALGEDFTTRFGVAFKETFTRNYPGYSDDPTTAQIEKTKVESGIESATGFKFGLMENILYMGQINLFSSFKHLDVWDVRWDNMINAKVNKYIQASMTLQLVYEKAQSPKTQLKESIAIGLTYAIF